MRISDRECTHSSDQSVRERLAFGHEPDSRDYLTSIQDVELGFRASEQLDIMEDIVELRWRFRLADRP